MRFRFGKQTRMADRPEKKRVPCFCGRLAKVRCAKSLMT